MNYRRQSALVFALLLTLVIASCVQPPAPTPAPTATSAPATPVVAEAATLPAATTAPAATTVAAAQRPAVPAPEDNNRPLAQLSAAERADRFGAPAPMSIVTDTIYVATIITDKGNIVAELYRDTPQSANNFVTLAKEGYYDGLTFHRVEPGFVIQGGDPLGTGQGGPGYTIPAEIKHSHPRGALAWARTGDEVNPNRESSGSQFYITLAETPFLDGGYTVFGNVIQGMDVADKIAVGDKIQRIDISTADKSLMPTPSPTALPVAPVLTDGRPVASKPITDRTGLYNAPPTVVIDPQKTYTATISSAKGDIVVKLDAANATRSVNNFVILSSLGFYDNMPVAFSQPGAYVVMGSPASRPDSDVGYRLELEDKAAEAKVITGTVAYYPFGNQSTGQILASGSQFFISLVAQPAEAQSTPLNVFGQVVSGQDVAAKLTTGDIITSIKIDEK